MNILFITSSRIGDAVLSTGLLDHIAREWPDSRVTVVCGPLSQTLFEGYPNLKEIIPLKKRRWNGHWLDLWIRARVTRWDIVVDLRNSIVSRLIPAKRRFIFGAHVNGGAHKIEQMAAVMRLGYVPAPRLWFTEEQLTHARKLLVPHPSPLLTGEREILAVGPTANWKAKTWPTDRFVEILKFMTAADGPMQGARVAVFAAKGEEEPAYEVFNALPESQRINVIDKADPGTAAAALSLCAFYIGNDSGLMHCAAAAGVKTLGLFGPSYPGVYKPWGPHCAFVKTPESFDQLIDYPGYDAKTAPCLMGSLSVEDLKNKVREMF